MKRPGRPSIYKRTINIGSVAMTREQAYAIESLVGKLGSMSASIRFLAEIYHRSITEKEVSHDETHETSGYIPGM